MRELWCLAHTQRGLALCRWVQASGGHASEEPCTDAPRKLLLKEHVSMLTSCLCNALPWLYYIASFQAEQVSLQLRRC